MRPPKPTCAFCDSQGRVLGFWLGPVKRWALHPTLFRTLLRLRLRPRRSEGYCPLCDGVADVYGDHSRVCPCGGDRVKRHNRLRSVLSGSAAAAVLSPQPWGLHGAAALYGLVRLPSPALMRHGPALTTTRPRSAGISRLLIRVLRLAFSLSLWLRKQSLTEP